MRQSGVCVYHPFMTSDPVISALTAITTALVFLVVVVLSTAAGKSRAAERWAKRHLAHVAPRWMSQVARQVEKMRRFHLASLLLFVWAATEVPRSGSVWALCVASVPALLALAQGVRVARESLPPGPRVARAREVSLADYVPDRTRWVMWIAAGLSCAVTITAAVYGSIPALVLPAVVLLLLAGLVETIGARLARAPEPAVDASHLYWQDCFRVDAVRAAASVTVLTLFYLFWVIPGLVDVQIAGVDDTDLGLGVGVVLVVVLLLVGGVGDNQRPVGHMRSRLWPELAPGEVVVPGSAVPTRGAVA